MGIELNDKAIEEARDNAEMNGIDNVKFAKGTAENIFSDEEVRALPREETTVVMDPPRKGSSPEFLQQLMEFKPMRVVYMSCGPDTQARDTKVILESGMYSLVEVQPMDLFPQTRHIECCAVYELI